MPLKFIAELADIIHDELACFVFAGHVGLLSFVCVGFVIIPIEVGITVFFDMAEERDFCLVENVETDHGIRVRLQFSVCRLSY